MNAVAGYRFGRLWEGSRKDKPGIDVLIILYDFKVQVRTSRVAGVAGCTDPLASVYTLAHAHPNLAQVSIHCGISVAVIDLDNVAVNRFIVTLRHDYTRISSKYL